MFLFLKKHLKKLSVEGPEEEGPSGSFFCQTLSVTVDIELCQVCFLLISRLVILFLVFLCALPQEEKTTQLNQQLFFVNGPPMMSNVRKRAS